MRRRGMRRVRRIKKRRVKRRMGKMEWMGIWIRRTKGRRLIWSLRARIIERLLTIL